MKNESGFTIMEMMVVIAIIAILAGITIPNMISWRANHQLNGTAREILSLLNNARIAAIKNNATVTVSYDAGTRTIQAVYTNRATGNPGPTITTELKPGVTIAGSTFPSNTVSFNSRGIPSNAGTITLTGSGGNPLRVTMASTGVTRIN